MLNDLKNSVNNLWKINNIIKDNNKILSDIIEKPKQSEVTRISNNFETGKLLKSFKLNSEIKSSINNVIDEINKRVDKLSESGEDNIEVIKNEVKDVLEYYDYNPYFYNIDVVSRKSKKLLNDKTYFTIDIKSNLSPYLKTINYLIQVIIGLSKYNKNLKMEIDRLKNNIK